jgi:predicted short-subunit dehydrogenase-like oxidoreductase (DUF2520 family)
MLMAQGGGECADSVKKTGVLTGKLPSPIRFGMKRTSKASVAIVGPGRVGQALGKALARAGVSIEFIAARRLERARQASRFIGRGRAVALDDPSLAVAKVFIISVADRAIAPVAKQLANLLAMHSIPGKRGKPLAGRIFLHTCGSVDATVLRPLARLGGACGSLHPFQTVPSPAQGAKNLVGTFWTTEGDPRACRLARAWVRLLKGKIVRIRSRDKTLYHLSAFLVCPTLIALMERATGFLEEVGAPTRVARAMLGAFVSETVKNFVAFGGRRSMTGPASRGDWAVIRRHRRELHRRAPEVLPVYDALLREILRLVRKQPPREMWKF